MSEYRRYETPEIERAYQAAHRELETMPPPRSAFFPEIDATRAVMSDLLGPDITWQTGRQAEEWARACRPGGFGAPIARPAVGSLLTRAGYPKFCATLPPGPGTAARLIHGHLPSQAVSGQ